MMTLMMMMMMMMMIMLMMMMMKLMMMMMMMMMVLEVVVVGSPCTLRPGGRFLFRVFLDPNNLTREKTFSLLGFSLVPLVLIGLLLPRQAFAFSRACRFWRIRELAIAAARDMFPRWLRVPRAKDGGVGSRE